ncbi:hypothetical protein GTO10_06730 [Candidatus Saccharibacteria bacterium]|nr:hypothetical protein [Candidatus Saccharibacteria bacterium]
MEKRHGGRLTEERQWVVLTESTRSDNDGWVHSCGEMILKTTVYLSHRIPQSRIAGDGRVRNVTVPYCPDCELAPTRGVFYDDGRWWIDSWEREAEPVA